MKKFVFALVALLGMATAAPAAMTPPDTVVRDATTSLQDLIRQNHVAYKADLDGFYAVVDKVVVPHFDVSFIARSVLARHWKTATDDQRKRFQDAFKNMLIHSYANALLEYHDSVKADWKPLRMPAGAEDVMVHSNLLREGKPPVSISFAMHVAEGQWRIYDIAVENISLVTNFRGQLSSEVKKSNLQAVIDRMETGEFSVKGRAQAAANAAAAAQKASSTGTP